ncbi:MAG: cupin domain-containing protein [Acidimicrobiia bacterium]
METFSVDPDELSLKLTGIVPEGGAHIRQVLLDEIETRLPRDAEARTNIQLSELSPGRTASWHIHNGIVYFVILRGMVTLQYEGRSEHYTAGDVYTEPIGVVHRAVNPHADIAAALIGFWVTAVDRPHVTEVGAPAWSPIEEGHPSL